MNVKSILTLNSEPVPISVYSDGSVSISVVEDAMQLNTPRSLISLSAKCPAGILALFMLMDHLRSTLKTSAQLVDVHLEYLPFARQDRVTGTALVSPFSLRTFCNLLQSHKNLGSVMIHDPHSEAAINLLQVPVRTVTQLSLIEDTDAMYQMMDDVDVVIAPDQGAFKKAKAVADRFELPLLVANKERNPETREIKLSFIQNADLKGKTVFVPDDIVDYGGSVNELSRLLKEQYEVGKVIVYASHGILPVNNRLPVPSRYSFILENVDLLYLHSLWTNSEINEVVPQNVFYVQDF